MNKEELLEGLTQDVLTYVMNGSVSTEVIAKNIKPNGLDERFDEYQKLIDLHFVLKPEVVAFAEALPEQLRGIKTQTKNVSQTKRGTVDGRINWTSTIKTRHTQNPADTSLFVCDHRSENYDVDENVVLKRLLSIIYSILTECEPYFETEYDWVTQRWRENTDLVRQLRQIFERNVHVRRIRKPEYYEPTERMLETAENSRQEVYRDAAKLLRSHQSILEGDEAALRTLLDETAITPDDEETLFELYVLFRFIATIDEMDDSGATVRTLQSGKQEVARVQGSKEVVLYYNTSATDRNLSFLSVPKEKSAVDLTRSEKVHRKARKVASDYFEKRFGNHTGRPDVIVLEIISEEQSKYEYLITEVKNSSSVDTIRTGIKETLEYLAFVRVNDEYVFEPSEDRTYFGSGWNGLLVVQDLDEVHKPLTDQKDEPIKILQASELDEGLETVIAEFL